MLVLMHGPFVLNPAGVARTLVLAHPAPIRLLVVVYPHVQLIQVLPAEPLSAQRADERPLVVLSVNRVDVHPETRCPGERERTVLALTGELVRGAVVGHHAVPVLVRLPADGTHGAVLHVRQVDVVFHPLDAAEHSTALVANGRRWVRLELPSRFGVPVLADVHQVVLLDADVPLKMRPQKTHGLERLLAPFAAVFSWEERQQFIMTCLHVSVEVNLLAKVLVWTEPAKVSDSPVVTAFVLHSAHNLIHVKRIF